MDDGSERDVQTATWSTREVNSGLRVSYPESFTKERPDDVAVCMVCF